MKQRVSYFLNMATVMRGTMVAQVLPVITAPIVSRLFTPEQFGVYYIFSSAVSILLLIITARYEQSILLPEHDEDAINLLAVVMLLVTFLSALTLVLLIIFRSEVAEWIGSEKEVGWFFLLSLSLFFNGCFLGFYNWCLRKNFFKTISSSKIIESVVNNGIKIFAGALRVGMPALILSTVFSQAAMLVVVTTKSWNSVSKVLNNVSVNQMWLLAKKFRHFPSLLLWGTLLNVAAYYLPNLLLPKFFGVETAGYFGFTQRIFQLPVAAISLAAGETFRQHSVEEIRANGNCHSLFLATLRLLIAVSTLPFLLLLLFAPPLFVFFFGASWQMAGVIAQIFAIPFFLLFIFSPFTSIFQSTGSLKIYLRINALFFLLVIASLVAGRNTENPLVVFYFLSASTSLIFLLQGYFSYRKSMPSGGMINS